MSAVMNRGAWTRYEGFVQPDGSVLVEVSTNDDEDRGHPTSFACWTESFASVDEFRAQRQSGFGWLGTERIVFLDGERI